MAMNVGDNDDDVMIEMNTTPLIDVLLVLLVMLIITIPLQTHAVKLDMPQATEQLEREEKPNVVRLDVDEYGIAIWNGDPVDSEERLEQLLAEAAVANPMPDIHLRPHPFVRYDHVAKILSAAQRLHVTRIGFVGNEQYMAE